MASLLDGFEADLTVSISASGSGGPWRQAAQTLPGSLRGEGKRASRDRHGSVTQHPPSSHSSSAPKPPRRVAARLAGLLVGGLLCALASQTFAHWSRAHLHRSSAADVAQRSFPSDSSEALPATSGAAAAAAERGPADWSGGVSAADADTFACHFFDRLGHLDFSSWELQQPDAVAALAVLRHLHPSERCTTAAPKAAAAATTLHAVRQGRHLSSAAATASAAPASAGGAPVVTDQSGAAVALAPLVEAVAKLRALSCSAGVAPPPLPQAPGGQPKVNLVGGTVGEPADGAAAPPPLPAGSFVAVRRLALAVMQQLWEQPGGSGWRHALLEAAPVILGDFHAAQVCGTTQRPVMELLHVSKSGGTSMCQLARMASRKAQHFDQDGNCLQEHFQDEPKWTTVPEFTRGQGKTASGRMKKNCELWPAYDCNQWLAVPEVSCAQRDEVLKKSGLDFFSNEHALHGSTAHPGSTHSCPQFETLVVMRDPVERVLSHISQISQIYMNFGGSCARGMAARRSYQLPRNLTYWSSFAPASVNNYFVRSLLGKHFHCLPHGGLSADHLHQAQVKLMTLDRIVLLEEGDRSDVVFRLGMGWPQTLGTTKMRQSWGRRGASLRGAARTPNNEELDRMNGFAPGSMALLAEWNDLDAQLFEWSKVALNLDSSFLATVAVLNNQTATTAPPPPPQRRARPPRPPTPAFHTDANLPEAAFVAAAAAAAAAAVAQQAGLGGGRATTGGGTVHSGGTGLDGGVGAGNSHRLGAAVMPSRRVQGASSASSSSSSSSSASQSAVHLSGVPHRWWDATTRRWVLSSGGIGGTAAAATHSYHQQQQFPQQQYQQQQQQPGAGLTHTQKDWLDRARSLPSMVAQGLLPDFGQGAVRLPVDARILLFGTAARLGGAAATAAQLAALGEDTPGRATAAAGAAAAAAVVVGLEFVCPDVSVGKALQPRVYTWSSGGVVGGVAQQGQRQEPMHYMTSADAAAMRQQAAGSTLAALASAAAAGAHVGATHGVQQSGVVAFYTSTAALTAPLTGTLSAQ